MINSLFNKLYKSIKEIQWKYLLNRTYCRTCQGAQLVVEQDVVLRKCKIYLYPNSILHIAEGSILQNCTISIQDGEFCIGAFSRLGSSENFSQFNIQKGLLEVGHHSCVRAKRIWVRFGGKCSLGNYTNINNGSEIRCDELVKIGDFNQISYNVNIWDTNTHCILPSDQRRKMTVKYFPYFGFEETKPKTAPVMIGDDCWISQNVSILKGSIIGNEVIVGYQCLISGKTIANKTTVVNSIDLKQNYRYD